MTGATETVAFQMAIDPAAAEEYRARHEAIWPDLCAALIEAGVVDYRIFLDGKTGRLFAVMERRRDHALAALAGAPVMQRWWSMMGDLMPQGADGAPWSEDLVEVFHLAAARPPRAPTRRRR